MFELNVMSFFHTQIDQPFLIIIWSTIFTTTLFTTDYFLFHNGLLLI